MQTNIIIQNLKCGGCASTITKKIQTIDGVSNLNIDVEKSSIQFEYDSNNILENVKIQLTKLGYPAEGDQNSIINKAKSFVSCATGRMNQ
ncbi:heavy-metal-associated domain-containing protein [Psychroflexus aestuariivivens]|uniref:heavy-metal-associated domain-containing protein n=1 Tax=Psychroflexus aestuariivivens TaxID=1795040 RepID=UPI000FDB89D2|nr:heavy-metal-associated domain-containing protein [Psychroflexus aestuariivivens]